MAFGDTADSRAKKVGPAIKSGMRGMAPLSPKGAGAGSEDGYDAARETPQEGHPDIAGIIGQHVHVDPTTGHHHLNLTTLAAHIHGGAGKGPTPGQGQV